MSTKCTIDHGPDNYWKRPTPEGLDYHIYYECLDDDNIYLELYDAPYIQTELLGPHNKPQKLRTTIGIPGKLWNHIVRLGELKSWGGEDFDNPKRPEQRSKEFEDGLNNTLAMLESFKKDNNDA